MADCMHPVGRLTLRASFSRDGAHYGGTCRCGACVVLDRETFDVEFKRRVDLAEARRG